MKRFLVSMVAATVLGFGGAALAATSGTLPGGLSYPVCDRTHSDQCLQLGQNTAVDRQLFKAYPQCGKMKGKLERGACINGAGGIANQ